MYQKELMINDKKVFIKLPTIVENNKSILDMSYLRTGLRITILKDELSDDLDYLNPEKIDKYISNDQVLHLAFMKQLEKVIYNHIEQFTRLFQSDLATYVTESIVILDAYYDQILDRSFEQEKKKEIFHKYFNYFHEQITPEPN